MDATLYQLSTEGATVLTASRQLAHRLRQEYATAAQARGLVVWSTPRILPWSTYLRVAAQQQRDGQTQGPRLLTERQALVSWEKIIADSDSGQALLNPVQAARNAQRSWQLLHQYRIPLAKVAAYPGAEAQAFADWAGQWLALTESRNWLDSARFAQYLAATDFQPDSALVVHGFDQQTPEMQALLQRWLARGAQVHQPHGIARTAQVQVVAAADGDAELRLAAQWARQQCNAGKARIAVVVPRLAAQAAQVQRRFAAVFAPAHSAIDQPPAATAFRVLATPALSSYPLVQHALWWLQLLQGQADVLLVGQLLRSPFLAGYETEAAARALADITAREQRRERWDCHELERLAAVTHCAQLAANLQQTGTYLRAHRGSALPSAWAERYTQLLNYSGWPRGRALTSTEQQTRDKFQQVLAQLSALDELLGSITLERATACLRDACHGENFAPESVDQAVTIVDADGFAGMQADAVWVMGLHAGDWPPAPEPDPFLPIELQRHYGIPAASVEGCLQLARRQLQRMAQAADTVLLSWPRQEEDAQLQPSPLLAAWPSLPADEVPQANTQTLAQQLLASQPIMDTFTDDHAPAQPAGNLKGGSRILELQSRCPFRAQAELRLHTAPMPSVSPAIEATERGKLVHRVLSEIWRELQDSTTLRATAMDELAQRVYRIAERTAQNLDVIPAYTPHRQRLAVLEVALATQWVMALLRVEAQRLPFRVRDAEQREAFEFAGLKLHIQLDRIDTLSDGGSLLIDYKTGEGHHANDWLDHTPGRPRSPQLPLYALAHRRQLAGISFAVLAPGTAEFRGLADNDDIAAGIVDYAKQKPGRKLPGIETWDDLLQHWHTVLAALAQQYLSGAAAVDPLTGECQYCHLSSLCRIHELRAAQNANLGEPGGDD